MNDPATTMDAYFDAVCDGGLVARSSPRARRNFRFFLENLFCRTDFAGKTVVDVGGGSGIFTFYAASRGAARVTCLEPEAAGSRSGMIEKFETTRSRLGLDNVTLVTRTLQSFEPRFAGAYDIVLLHNSVNHLDEAACIRLRTCSAARGVYEALFARLFALAASGARLIISDCSCDNVFPRLGRKNPFAPSIEWHKHQSPRFWEGMLLRAGFCNPVISWRAPSVTRSWGDRLLGNRLAAYFLTSHFVLEMQKPAR